MLRVGDTAIVNVAVMFRLSSVKNAECSRDKIELLRPCLDDRLYLAHPVFLSKHTA